MEVKLNVPEYDISKGIKYQWKDGFEIEVKKSNNQVTITANREGLISLANHLLNLAQDSVPLGRHLHFDKNNSLEEGSQELIIEKK